MKECGKWNLSDKPVAEWMRHSSLCHTYHHLIFAWNAPDVIIVCDTDTLQALNKNFGLDLLKPSNTITRGKADVDVHDWRSKRLLWAPHPAAHIRPGDWVDVVLAATR